LIVVNMACAMYGEAALIGLMTANTSSGVISTIGRSPHAAMKRRRVRSASSPCRSFASFSLMKSVAIDANVPARLRASARRWRSTSTAGSIPR
jgi:hypothetical protein